ncbi:hypothetical protein NC651_034081 [Populus alba x Populus x berolinensis]|nr:hypothetical protein NC651_034081 [Populus alba x Populus x berolinensis]
MYKTKSMTCNFTNQTPPKSYLSYLHGATFSTFRLRKKSETNKYLTTNPSPGPWKLPLVGNIHQVAGRLIHHRFTGLARKYGPVMQILLGEVRFVVISSRETAIEVMKINENIFVDRPDGVIPRIVFYSGKAISFTPYGEYWKQLRKICSSKLLSPQCVRSLRSTMEEEVSDFATSISSKEGSPINLSKMLLTLTFGLISRVILDIFPSFKLFHSLGCARSKFVRQHQEIGEMLETIINERRASKIRTKTSEHEIEEDFLDVLVNMQHSGNLEFTNDNIKAILLVNNSISGNLFGWERLVIGSYGMSTVRNAKESKTHEKGTERSEGSFFQDGK